MGYSFFDARTVVRGSTKLPPGALCGPGMEYQGNVQTTENPSFELLTAPSDDTDLQKLAQDTNTYFEAKASTLITKKRKDAGVPRLELTVLLAPEGFRLAYAYPKYGYDRRRPAPTPQWVLGGRFWLWLSRRVYHLFHLRRRSFPASAWTQKPAPRPKLGLKLPKL